MLHPQWHACFLGLLMLDVFSHWFQMYAALVSGAATHKVPYPTPTITYPIQMYAKLVSGVATHKVAPRAPNVEPCGHAPTNPSWVAGGTRNS